MYIFMISIGVMPIIEAQKKSLKRNKKMEERNLSFKNAYRRKMKQFEAAVNNSAKKKELEKLHKEAVSAIDKAAQSKRNIIPQKRAARKKRRLAKMLNEATS